jgi:hypothetical protein
MPHTGRHRNVAENEPLEERFLVLAPESMHPAGRAGRRNCSRNRQRLLEVILNPFTGIHWTMQGPRDEAGSVYKLRGSRR